MIGAGLLAAIIGTLVWLAITAIRPTPGMLESYAYGAVILALALGTAAQLTRSSAGRTRYDVALIWILLSLVTAIGLPGAGYLFAWPALAAVVALNWRADGEVPRLLRLSFVAAPALLLLMPAVDFFFQMAQPRPGNPDSEMPVVVVLPLFLSLAVAGLLRVCTLPPRGPGETVG